LEIETKRDNYAFGWLISQFISAFAAGSGHRSTSSTTVKNGARG